MADESLVIAREDAVELLTQLGIKGADNWSDSRLIQKLKQLPTIGKDDPNALSDKGAKRLLKEVLSALKSGNDISVTDADDEDEDDVPPPKKSSKGSKKKPEPEEDEEEEDEDDSEESEDDDEEEEDEPAPKSKKSTSKNKGKTVAKKTAKPEKTEKKSKKNKEEAPAKKGKKTAAPVQRFGIVDAIKEMLEGASKSNPITKEKIWKGLCKKFKSHPNPDGMKTTVRCQLSTHLPARGYAVATDGDGGYWKGKGAPEKKSKKSDKKKKSKK